MTRARTVSKLGNPSVFTVDTSNNVGVNSTSPTEKLNVVGVVSATSFYGDGSNLQGVATSKQLTIGVRVGAAITFAVVGTGFTVDGRSAAITIDV
tara:strand:+ start:127 stop:411 length:285 start_codon:yes stop_codon:yes gene_type:complete